MNFTQAHNDHLDPDRHCQQAQEEQREAIEKALAAWDTNRWQWETLDLTLTGKDADLDGGSVGIELLPSPEDATCFNVHIGATIPGTDVCLNLSDAGESGVDLAGMSRSVSDSATVKAHCASLAVSSTKVSLASRFVESDDTLYEQAREEYMEQAQEIVCGMGIAGEWSGDDWYMSDFVTVSTEHVTDDNGEVDAEATAQAIIDAAWKAIQPLTDEIALANDPISIVAGWKDTEGNRIPEKH